MKKLNEELFINVKNGYGKDLKDKFKKLLFDIGLAIIKDEYLVNNNSEGSKRLFIGIQVGYGITPRGMQPYLGLGVSYKFGF